MDFSSHTRVHSNFNQFLTWFLSQKSLYVEKEEPWNIPLFAKNLGHLYRALSIVNDGLEKVSIPIKALPNDELHGKDSDYLKPVLKLKEFVNKDMSNDLCDFLVHGSIATLDYSKGWSDLDTFVIVNSETILDYQRLVEFRAKIVDAYKFLLEIDPLQHHGFIFCSETGLNQYYSHFLPLEVISESKSLLHNQAINLSYKRLIEDAKNLFRNKNALLHSATLEKVLKHHKYENNYLYENYENPNAMYQLKYFLSIVMTLPAYYLDARGTPCYKKESFAIVKDDFPDNWEIVEQATEIREKWPSKELQPYVGNTIPEWVIEILGREYFYRAFKLSSKMLDMLENAES